METQTVFDYIRTQENNYQTNPVPVIEGWEWNMYKHIRLSTLYKNSKYAEKTNELDPYKNIIRPILNVAYRTEGFDIKDIVPFVNCSDYYYKSLLVKKYHDKWARENNMDTVIDGNIESTVDYGLGLLKKLPNSPAPEVVPLQSLAFCDQTDILSGPICIKHYYSPDQLKEMAGKKWKNIDEVIVQARSQKENVNARESKTPGKYIEVFELHGVFPESWLNEKGDPDTYSRQMHLVTYYKNKKGDEQGISLYGGPLSENPFKADKRDPIHGRACGWGGVEELFEAQIWTNYDVIRIKEMLDVVSKITYQTADQAFEGKNKIKDVDNGHIYTHEEGKPLTQVNTGAPNVPALDASVQRWEAHAMQMGSASEAIMGESPSSGTPFKLQEVVIQEGKGMHDYRQGKRAQFWGEVYRDWVLPEFVKDMNKEQEFMEEVTLEELQYIVDRMVVYESNNIIKRAVLAGKTITQEEVDLFNQQYRETFMKGGNKRFFKTMKDELKDIPVDVYVNIKGKQKNLAATADKLTNIFRNVFANPQVLENPQASKIFNEILEASGLSQVDFSTYKAPVPPIPAGRGQLPVTA